MLWLDENDSHCRGEYVGDIICEPIQSFPPLYEIEICSRLPRRISDPCEHKRRADMACRVSRTYILPTPRQRHPLTRAAAFEHCAKHPSSGHWLRKRRPCPSDRGTLPGNSAGTRMSGVWRGNRWQPRQRARRSHLTLCGWCRDCLDRRLRNTRKI